MTVPLALILLVGEVTAAVPLVLVTRPVVCADDGLSEEPDTDWETAFAEVAVANGIVVRVALLSTEELTVDGMDTDGAAVLVVPAGTVDDVPDSATALAEIEAEAEADAALLPLTTSMLSMLPV